MPAFPGWSPVAPRVRVQSVQTSVCDGTGTVTGVLYGPRPLVDAAHPVDGDLLDEELIGVVQEIGVGNDIIRCRKDVGGFCWAHGGFSEWHDEETMLRPATSASRRAYRAPVA